MYVHVASKRTLKIVMEVVSNRCIGGYKDNFVKELEDCVTRKKGIVRMSQSSSAWPSRTTA